MTPEQLARSVKRWRDDEVFALVIKEIEARLSRTLLNATSSEEEVAQAREVVRGISALEREVKSILDSQALLDKKKGQHRGSD